MRLKGLPPIVDERARVLILGSFPSVASLDARRYYAHPQNQFWRILSAILDLPLVGAEYATQQTAVKAAGLAIWDVYASCERTGSLDAAIRAGKPNRFEELHHLAPNLERVCFNGCTAAKLKRTLDMRDCEMVVLPSTSPAYAGMSLERKLKAWRQGLLR